jgi:magnesium transporter
MSNNLNRVIRILTVLTVILAIPTLVGSLYGMNVKLPLGSVFHAFSIVVAISIIISMLAIMYFRKQKWL